MRELELFVDGASKGNPGPSGAGIVMLERGKVIRNISKYLGEGTNNYAEYMALIYGLQEALKLKAEAVRVSTDSQLLYRQLKKIYRVKHPNIIGLYNQAVSLLDGFKHVTIRNIPREENCGADKLATEAVKKALKKHSLTKGQAGCGCPCSFVYTNEARGRKVRAPEDSVVGNTYPSGDLFGEDFRHKT